MIRIRRALVSVSDKSGLEKLGKALDRLGVEILSTGGTASTLRKAGVRVTEVSDVTGFPECLGGRVKTLHPKLHAGILAERTRPEHMQQLEALGVTPIDLVVVNLYPFEEAALRPGISRYDLIEEIDIGGPTLLRAAAKNAAHVAVLCDPADYARLVELLDNEGGVPQAQSEAWALKVFALTAAYDATVAQRLRADSGVGPGEGPPPGRLALGLVHTAHLRYGENPHQAAAFYRPAGLAPAGLAALHQIQGKELSYNNYLDMDAAYRLAGAYTPGAAVVVKHLNPCGIGFDEDPERAWRRALAADPLSAFGGIVAWNRPLTRAAAEASSEVFLEVLVAPRVEPEARAVLERRKNLRVIEAQPAPPPLGWDIRAVAGGWLVQSGDGPEGDTGRRTVSRRAPSAVELTALERAWTAVRHARSNAIVIGAEDGLLGLGSGQTSRVDAVNQAVEKAKRSGIKGGARVLASDAFFPFRDGIDAAAAGGVTAVIQPGGSLRDEEVILAADAYGMAMVFTGRRAFRH